MTSYVTQDGLMEELEFYAKDALVQKLWRTIERLQDKVAQLENKCYHLDDDIRNVRYTAEDALTQAQQAKDAADRTQRGW